MNANASAIGEEKKTTVGEVARDSNGNWLCGFHGAIGNADVHCAEFGALVEGLQLAWDRRIL